MKKKLRADEIISILEAPLDLSWRRYKNWDINVVSDPAKHFYARILRLERQASVRELLGALEIAPTPRSRYVILDVLGKRKAKSAVPTIVRYLSNRSWRVRNASADALMHICDTGDVEVGEALFERLDVKERKISLHSTLAVALGAVRYRPAVPALIRVLDSGDEVVRRCAAGALSDLGGVEATNALQAAINREQLPSTRAALIEYLHRILEIAKCSGVPDSALAKGVSVP
jgi:HEAT repeat protein